jgi:tRNA-specific 2-thiouridylase
MCNKHVKFGAFMEFAKSHGADYIATGHYARRIDGEVGTELHRGIDPGKDQSYFLWTLTTEQLAYTLLPIGDTIKDRIRTEAAQAGLPTAQKRDSQGICFLGHVDIREFLSHYTELNEGPVLNENGEVIGTHHGALIYTPGQRHGLTINTKETTRPQYFVVSKDVAKNTVIVSTSKPLEKSSSTIKLHDVVLRSPITTGSIVEAQVRYHQTPFAMTVTNTTANTLELSPTTATDKAVPGQSCVLYSGSLCLGGGIIA